MWKPTFLIQASFFQLILPSLAFLTAITSRRTSECLSHRASHLLGPYTALPYDSSLLRSLSLLLSSPGSNHSAIVLLINHVFRVRESCKDYSFHLPASAKPTGVREIHINDDKSLRPGCEMQTGTSVCSCDVASRLERTGFFFFLDDRRRLELSTGSKSKTQDSEPHRPKEVP